MINTPFNFTGSKFKLLEQLLPEFDYTKKYFIDLFCGGGSVYTNIVDKYEKILVNDIIIELIEIHKNLIESDDIIQKTKLLCPEKDDPKGFQQLRDSFNKEKSPEKLWALMLCSTNNLMRFNKQLLYNQTFGKRKYNDSTQKKVNEFTNHIRQYKDKIVFVSKHFSEVKITKPSMVYLDPPYTNSEAGYNPYWSKDDDLNLYNYIKDLDKNSSSFVISGILGEHKNGKKWELMYKLIADGYKYKILNHDYEKVARKKDSKNSQEIIIKNFNI